MAEYGAVAGLLNQVEDIIKGYSNLISGVEEEFRRLKEDIQQLKLILEEMPNASIEDTSVGLFKNKIQDDVYEVEDALDSCLTEANAKHKLSRKLSNTSLASKLKSLRLVNVYGMLEEAKNMRSKLVQHVVATNEPEIDQRRTVQSRPIRQDKVVGLEDEENKIIGYLMTDQPKLDIIPIIGMPGLGKTTLTRKIFNDERIRYAFPIRIWVHFSERLNSKDVLIQILRTFTTDMDELHSKNEKELSHVVRTCLSGVKFLLVVDGLEEKKHWDGIKDALPYDNSYGKVVITSRQKQVGEHVQSITNIHNQRSLNHDESWELLQLEVFGAVDICPSVLEDIGQLIATRCNGVPLTIAVIGGVLKDQRLSLNSDTEVKKKWIEMVNNFNLALGDNQVIFDVVGLSYRRLPIYLRDCFLYLGVFPAGYQIHAWTLMRLWIAEGFIQPNDRWSLEETAQDYLNDLVNRNLLMVDKENSMQEVKYCRVSDMVRLFCTNEAMKQNMFKVVTRDYTADMEKIHRLCLHSDVDKFIDAKPNGPKLRSFLSFNPPADVASDYVYNTFLSLRILEAKSMKVKKFPTRLIELIHLRCIVMFFEGLEILPKEISDLWNLQTMIVYTNSDIITMKASLWKMIRLRHLKTKSAIVLDKRYMEGDQAGDNLQTLNRISPESVLEVSKHAKNLKTLGVKGKLAPLLEDMPLGNLDRLEKLKLYNTQDRLQHFPESNHFPPNLKRLTLSNTFLDWKHMSTLAMIQGLEVLKLKDNAFTGFTWKADDYAFDRLLCLVILNLDLVIWTASDDTFPRLRHLEVKNCDELNIIPDSVLKSLEELDIARVRSNVVEHAKNFAAIKLRIGGDTI